MTTPGQTTIGGEMISGVKLKLAGLTLDTLPPGITWEQLTDLERTARIRFECEAVVTRTPGVASRYDSDLGDEIGEVTGVIELMPVRSGFRVTNVQTVADREATWVKAHSG